MKGENTSLLDDSVIIHIKNPKDFTKNKLSVLVSKFVKVQRFKVNIQNQLHMLTMNNWKNEIEIIISFYHSIQNMKYLEINITKYTQSISIFLFLEFLEAFSHGNYSILLQWIVYL